MFPTEDSLYLLTDAAMALKVDPETLDTTDEVRNKRFKKVPESSQNVKTRVANFKMAEMTSIKGSFLALGARSQSWKLNNL